MWDSCAADVDSGGIEVAGLARTDPLQPSYPECRAGRAVVAGLEYWGWRAVESGLTSVLHLGLRSGTRFFS